MVFKKLLDNCELLLDEMCIDDLKSIGLDRTLESYYLIGPYPPLAQMDEYHLDGYPVEVRESKNNSVDLYIHFPYCKVVGKYECTFCHFYKEIYDSNEERKVVENWINEIELYRKEIGNFKISTIYFGGGSVSLISSDNLKNFANYLINNLGIDLNLGVKFEIHADSSKEQEKLLEILDVLRIFTNLKIIIDIQSLNPKTLNYVTWGRIANDAYFKTLSTIIEEGFKHICTGLILGLPFETPESFLEGVSDIIMIPEIEMLNIYPLMFRECDHVSGCLKHSPEIMFDIKTRDVIHLATRKLLRSFGFYESPLYFYSRGTTKPTHQINKFKVESSLIGIGPSAFGHISGTDSNFAYYNLASITKHDQRLDNHRFPFWKTHVLSEDSKHIRQIIRNLNMLKKFRVDMLSENIRYRMEVALSIFQSYGLIEKEGDEWMLTEKGKLRVEEMAYYVAEIDLGTKLFVDLKEINKFPYHCFPNRNEYQVLKWKDEWRKHER